VRDERAQTPEMAKCSFCEESQPRYSCPRCSAPYCSLRCYQSSRHVACAEAFYEGEVRAEAAFRAAEDGQKGKVRMLEALSREAEQAEGSVDSDDSDDETDLESRLLAVDLDDADEVWRHLTKEEKRDFERALQSGKINELVPEFEPWWKPRKRPAVIEVSQEDEQPRLIPPILTAIPLLSSLTRTPPNDKAVAYCLLNALYAYCYGARFFQGQHGCEDSSVAFACLALDLSSSLSANATFSDVDSALESAAQAVNVKNRWAVSPQMTRGTKRDVVTLVSGGRDFALAALSDLHSGLVSGAKALSKRKKMKTAPSSDAPPWQRENVSLLLEDSWKSSDMKKAAKKIEFYLSWTLENSQGGDHLLRTLT